MSRTKTKTVVVFQSLKAPKLYLQTIRTKGMATPKGYKLVDTFNMEVV